MNAHPPQSASTDSACVTALDRINIATLLLTAEGLLHYANRAARQLLIPGTERHVLNDQELLHQLNAEQQQELREACLRFSETPLSLQLTGYNRLLPVQLHLTPLPVQDNGERLLQVTLKDMSGYNAAGNLPVHLYQAMQQTEDMVMVTDCHGAIEYVNPAFISQTGYCEQDVLGHNPKLLSSDEHDDAFYAEMWRTLRAGQSFRAIFINRRRNGERYHEEKTITPIRDNDGCISHFVATGRDISDLIHSEQRLDYLRCFDPLTGLPNRQRLSEQFAEHLTKHNPASVALFIIDIDRLSRINDSLGRDAGDELLRQTASRLRNTFAAHFTGRLGSDAFMLIAEGIDTADQAAHLAQHIRQIMALPFKLAKHELFMNASLGITLYPHDGVRFDELVNKADSAMHRCKESDQGFSFFTEDLTRQTQSRVQMENQLRQALLHKEFHLVFQPRVDLKTGNICSVEALLRWIRHDGSVVSPAEFIPVLEEMGLITSVGEWVLMRACHFASQWRQQGYPLRISVNLSARQLRQPNLLKLVQRCLQVSGLEPQALELELTETSMLADVEHSIRQLSQLRQTGIRIAIDDFGTGYSSLAYLKKLPADTLKIDRAFIQELESRDQTDFNIVQTIVQLAQNLGLNVTAEGIETAYQLKLLTRMGCDEAQGFLLARPMNEIQLHQLMHRFDLDTLLAGQR